MANQERSESFRRARRRLLNEAGGTHSTGKVADHLGLSPGEVRRRVRRGELLALRDDEDVLRFPRVQFDESGTIDGLSLVLQAMHVTDPWMRLQLLLGDDVHRALKDGRVEDAVRSVGSYLPADW